MRHPDAAFRSHVYTGLLLAEHATDTGRRLIRQYTDKEASIDAEPTPGARATERQIPGNHIYAVS